MLGTIYKQLRYSNSSLVDCVRNSDITGLSYLLEKGHNPDGNNKLSDNRSTNPLIHCIAERFFQGAVSLVLAGANPNYRTRIHSDSRTPLSLAICYNITPLVMLMVWFGGDPYQKFHMKYLEINQDRCFRTKPKQLRAKIRIKCQQLIALRDSVKEVDKYIAEGEVQKAKCILAKLACQLEQEGDDALTYKYDVAIKLEPKKLDARPVAIYFWREALAYYETFAQYAFNLPDFVNTETVASDEACMIHSKYQLFESLSRIHDKLGQPDDSKRYLNKLAELSTDASTNRYGSVFSHHSQEAVELAVLGTKVKHRSVTAKG